MKIVINTAVSMHDTLDISLSAAAAALLSADTIISNCRDDLELISVVEKLGSAASGHGTALKIVDIPDDVEWEIVKYYGREVIQEKHRTWR